MYRAAFILLIASQAVAADPPQAVHPAAATVRLPAQIQAQPGQPFAVVAEGNLKWMRWTVPSGLTRVPPELTACGEKGFVGYGPAGVYEFRCEGTLNDVFCEAKCVVFVGQPSPIPPGPLPPAPPSDTLAAELQKLFTADKGTAPTRDRLCELWTSAVAQVRDNPEHATIADFAKAMHATSAKFPFSLTDADLRGVRSRLAAELASACGGNAVALGAPRSECRMKAAGVLERFSIALSQCR